VDARIAPAVSFVTSRGKSLRGICHAA